MKYRLLSALLCIVSLYMPLQAEEAVSMVSYQQTWLDNNGTIALKNNTDEPVHNVTFQLEYLDMNGTPTHYEVYTYDIDIDPGMTKKLDIPAYEHGRHYQYYLSSDKWTDYPEFKVRYELKDYNTGLNSNQEKVSSYEQSDSETFTRPTEAAGHSDLILAPWILICILIGFIILIITLYVMVAVMAKRRNRNPALWLLLSFLATPLLICIVLLAIGNSDRRNNNFYS